MVLDNHSTATKSCAGYLMMISKEITNLLIFRLIEEEEQETNNDCNNIEKQVPHSATIRLWQQPLLKHPNIILTRCLSKL